MRALVCGAPEDAPLADAVRGTLGALEIRTTDYAPGAGQIMIVGTPAPMIEVRALAHALRAERKGWALVLPDANDIAVIVCDAGDGPDNACLMCALAALKEGKGAHGRDRSRDSEESREGIAMGAVEAYLSVLAARARGTNVAVREGHQVGQCTGPWPVQRHPACPVCGEPESARRRIEGLTLRATDIEMEADRPGQHPPALGAECRRWLEAETRKGPLARAVLESSTESGPRQWTVRARTRPPEATAPVECNANARTEEDAYTRCLEMILNTRASGQGRWIDESLEIDPGARDIVDDAPARWEDGERRATIASGVSYADALAEALARAMTRRHGPGGALPEGGEPTERTGQGPEADSQSSITRVLDGGPATLGGQRARLARQIARVTGQGARRIVARDLSLDDAVLRTVEISVE